MAQHDFVLVNTKNHENSTFKSKIKKVNWPCEEKDIIELQDTFLTNGLQRIHMDSFLIGRSIIETFLSSFNYYHDSTILTLETISPNQLYSNLYVQLSQDGYLDLTHQKDFDEFFIESFYFDFLWIEESCALLNERWYQLFRKTLISFGFDQTIPIIFITSG